MYSEVNLGGRDKRAAVNHAEAHCIDRMSLCEVVLELVIPEKAVVTPATAVECRAPEEWALMCFHVALELIAAFEFGCA